MTDLQREKFNQADELIDDLGKYLNLSNKAEDKLASDNTMSNRQRKALDKKMEGYKQSWRDTNKAITRLLDEIKAIQKQA